MGAADTPEPTLRASIWDLLNLTAKPDREELRKAYREFVLKRHPDVKGAAADPDFAEKFERVTTRYKEVMEMNDDRFWLAAFDAGATQIATGKVNSPSLNPWETRYRNWARATGRASRLQLEDDIDVSEPAEFFLSESSTEAPQPEEAAVGEPTTTASQAAQEGKPVNGHAEKQGRSPLNGQELKDSPPKGESADSEQSESSPQVLIFVGGALLLLGTEVQVFSSIFTANSG